MKSRFKKLQKKNDFLVVYNEELSKISTSAHFLFDSMLFSLKTFFSHSTEKLSSRVNGYSTALSISSFPSSSVSLENLVHNQTVKFLLEKEDISKSE